MKDMSLSQWEDCLKSNMTSTFLCIREYFKGLEAGIQGGLDGGRFGSRASVVLVGSTAGKFGEAGFADYAANKSGKHFHSFPCLNDPLTSLCRNDVRFYYVTQERNCQDRAPRPRQFRSSRLDCNSLVCGQAQGHPQIPPRSSVSLHPQFSPKKECLTHRMFGLVPFL